MCWALFMALHVLAHLIFKTNRNYIILSLQMVKKEGSKLFLIIHIVPGRAWVQTIVHPESALLSMRSFCIDK